MPLSSRFRGVTMTHPLRRPTPYYCLIQGLYWAVFCLMVGFASAFLLDRGFTNAQIGLTLGISYLLSAFLQPVVGSLFSRNGLKLSTAIALTYVPVVVISLILCLVPMGHIPLMILMVALFTIQSLLQPSVNALCVHFDTETEKVNFSLARGVGSAAYALSSFVMGRLLAYFSPEILPAAYGLAAAALIVVLLCAKTTNDDLSDDTSSSGNASYADILKQHPTMGLFLPGVFLLFLTFAFIDAFMLQIILSIGGTTSDLGTAITLCAMTELPAMILYARICKRGKGLKVYMYSLWLWLVKDILIFLAPTVGILFAVQLLTFVSSALYVPGMMEYMRRTLPDDQLLRGATMAGTCTTLGSLGATCIGGVLIDAFGIRQALLIMEVFGVLATVLLTIALTHAIKEANQGTVP